MLAEMFLLESYGVLATLTWTGQIGVWDETIVLDEPQEYSAENPCHRRLSDLAFEPYVIGGCRPTRLRRSPVLFLETRLELRFGGALAQAVIAGIAAWIMLVILGVPSPLPLALIMALLDLIPLVGATLGAVIVGVVTLFVDFPTTTIIWAVFAIAYQQFENYVVQPRIQSRAVELDPFLVVVAALFGGALLGVIGALLAIPIAASIQIALREWMEYRREYGPLTRSG
jgi:hypothetical protein